MKGGRGRPTPIPTQPAHLMERGKSDVGDVVEGGGLRVDGEEPQVIPPLSSGGVPLKGERRMAPPSVPRQGSTRSRRSYPCAEKNLPNHLRGSGVSDPPPPTPRRC